MIHYKKIGQGEPLILIHGFPNDSEAFNNIIEPLSRHFLLILIDLPGAGQSVQALPANLKMDDFGDAVMEIVHHLGLENVHFAGHSMGGYTCANIAERFPKVIKSIIYIHSGTTADDEAKIKLRQKSILLMQKGAKEQRIFLKALFNNFFEHNFTVSHQQLVDQYVNKGMQLPPTHLAAFYNAIMLRRDTRYILSAAEYPICWIAGEKDTAVTYTTILKEVALAPKAKLVSFTNCGHCAMEEMPNELTEEIIKFLNDSTIFKQ